MTQLLRTDFVRRHLGQSLNVKDPAFRQKLQGHPAALAKLDAVAGPAGTISGPQIDEVWLKVIDHFDSDGSLASINHRDGSNTLTTAGVLADAISASFTGAVAVQIDNVTSGAPPQCRGLFNADFRGKFKGKVAFTFDDGPHPTYTMQIVAELDRAGLKGSFFWLGSAIQRNPGIVKQVLLGGHQVCCHTFTHPNFKDASVTTVKREIMLTQQALDQVIANDPELQQKFPHGYKMTEFRPPYGILTDAVKQAAAECGMSLVMWGVDTNDWRVKDNDPDRASKLVREAMESTPLNGGGTVKSVGGPVLFHDIHANAGALAGIIAACTSTGAQMMTLRDLHRIKDPSYANV
jgi:peptidoglycan/xylan/chitin deacetylase (PgdA/CDA1 family)